MSVHVSIFQLLMVIPLALMTAAWVTFVSGIMRRRRFEAAARHSGGAPRTVPVLSALPHQRRTPPELESVELSPAEQDAFAGLVRRLGGR